MVRIIGDIHGNRQYYRKLIEGQERSLQLGDLDFYYGWMDDIDPKKSNFIKGNHDGYNQFSPHDLGDFGPVPFIPSSFFMRGGFSLDVSVRTPGFDWFSEEELSFKQLRAAINQYKAVKPDVMFSHECPHFLVPNLCDGRLAVAYGFEPFIKTRTGLALQEMWEFHKPKLWFFGHYHTNFDQVIDGTRFICLISDGRSKWVAADLNTETLEVTFVTQLETRCT